ncbi:MAG: hypothetical protein PHH93_02905 [Prolixibacteraceae bacterium]|nr:hypothetical protein [Prolixibacteraceae bacterium]
MLSYKPPFLEAGNLTIFRDDCNPETYYYICLQPSVCTDGNGEPVISAYAVLPESGVGIKSESIVEASLMMDIDLKPTQEELALAEKAIKEKFGKKPEILAPAPLHSGKVYLIMAQAGEEPDPKTWFITSEVKPSLFGNNRASLVVKASGKEAKQLVAALDADSVAASIHYELEIIGIAPVFKASLVAHWDKIYHHFDKLEHLNLIFYNDQVSNAVDELTETSAIEIQIEELDPDIRAEAMKNMLNELKSEVVQRLFKPASSPLSAAKNWEEKIGNAATRIVTAIIPGMCYMRRTVDEKQLVTTTINLSQRNAKRYPYFPQSLLYTLINSAGGISERIKWIKLDEIPFIDQRVEIRLSADTFTSSNIKSVVVDCRVVNETSEELVTHKSVVFDSDDALQNHLNFTRQKGIKYRYDYKAAMFMVTSSNKLPGKMELEWISADNPYIYVNPAEYFETHEIDINLDDTSIFNRTHLIQADVDVKDAADNEMVLQRSYLFKQDDTEHKVLSVVANKNTPLKFDLKLTYFITESKEHTTFIEDVKENFFFIPNPFENKWSVDIICNADWGKTNKIILETRVFDAELADPLFSKFTFNNELTEQQLTVACSLDTPKHKLEYRVTGLTADNEIIQGPWRMHEGPILVISDRLKSERIIRAAIIKSPDFEKKEIKKVTIEFKYEDLNNGIDIVSERMAFRGSDDVVEFRHPMPDFNKKEYMYRMHIRGVYGDTFKTDWITDKNDKLELIIEEDIW